MTHVDLEIPDDVATTLRERAETLGMSVPRYVAEIVCREVAAGWPPRFFQAELLFGARRRARVDDNLELLVRFFAPFVCLPFDDRCAESYGQIRATLARLGTPIGPNDLMTAATACAYELTLVSHNVSEFSRVPGLRLEDWEVRPVPDVTS